MKKTEIIFGILLLISFILRFFLVPGGIILSVFSLSILALLYQVFGIVIFNNIKIRNLFKKESFRGVSAIQLIGSVGVGFGLSMVCIGVLYKLQNWPGANFTTIVGLSIIILLTLITFIEYLKSKRNYFSRILKRVVLFGIFGFVFLSLNSMSITKIEYRNHPDYLKAIENYLNDTTNDTLKEKMEYEYLKTFMSEEELKLYHEYNN